MPVGATMFLVTAQQVTAQQVTGCSSIISTIVTLLLCVIGAETPELAKVVLTAEYLDQRTLLKCILGCPAEQLHDW